MLMRKTTPIFSIKALDEKSGAIEGYASTFGGDPDSYGDVVEAGAFAGSLADHRQKNTMPKMFWQHDPGEVIGKWIEVEEDEIGLKVLGRLNMDVQRGREAYALLKSGDIDGLSIGYRLKRHEIDDDTGVWFLKEIDLVEVSVVSIGANEHATVASVKAMKAGYENLEKLRAGDRLTEREFESVLKGILGLSNSQAERAARVHLKEPGDPAAANDCRALLEALRG